MKLLKHYNLSVLREERGWSFEPVTSEILSSGEVKNIHLVSMQPGTVRGNHVHHRQVEKVIVFGGRCLLVVEDDSGRREETTIESNQFILFEIPPGIAHVFKNIGDDVMYLLALCDRSHLKDAPDREERLLLPKTRRAAPAGE